MTISADQIVPHSTDPLSHPWISWAAVLAGVTVAIAVQIGLAELCLAAGMALYQPAEPGSAAVSLAVGTVAALLVCSLISVFVGGWVSGRMKCHHSPIEAAVHGMLVWAVSGIAALILTGISIGMLAGGALSLLGQGISGAAKGVGAAVPAVVQATAPSWEEIKKDIMGAMDNRDSSHNAQLSDSRFADRSRMMQLLAQSFSKDGTSLSDADRDELQNLAAGQLGIPPAAARAAYDQWQRVWKEGVSHFESAKEDAQRVAKNAAAVSAKRLGQAAMAALFAMIVGLCAAIAGALSGSACAMKRLASQPITSAANRIP